MPRDFVFDGEVLVKVKGGQHTSILLSGSIATATELGLASEPIKITPRFIHKDIHADDFGPEIPPELVQYLADATIRMSLIHYDRFVLDTCLAESIGGGLNFAGVLQPGGSLIGNNRPLFASGCHYVSVNLLSPVLNLPYRFPSCVMTGPPVEIPMGTGANVVKCTFRAIPYTPLVTTYQPGFVGVPGEASSSGAILWDHNTDQ